jgi:hypothetical protein
MKANWVGGLGYFIVFEYALGFRISMGLVKRILKNECQRCGHKQSF